MSFVELWGWCPDCARWFYSGHGAEGAVTATDCPVCLRTPVRLEHRPMKPTHHAEQDDSTCR